MKYLLIVVLALIAASIIFSTVLAMAWKLAGILVTAIVLYIGYRIIKHKVKNRGKTRVF